SDIERLLGGSISPLQKQNSAKVTGGGVFSGTEGREQIANLLLDMSGVADGLGDFLTQAFSIAPPETVDGHLDRSLARVQFAGQLAVRSNIRVAGQNAFEPVEDRAFARLLVFGSQVIQNLVEQRHRPAALKQFLGGQVVGWLAAIPPFSRVKVERTKDFAAAALLGLSAIVGVGQEMFASGQKERTEFALVPIHCSQRVFLKEAGEEVLSEILGVVDVITPVPNVGIQRIPVSTAQHRQRFAGLGCRLISGCQHETPARGCEPRTVGNSRIPIGIRRRHASIVKQRRLYAKKNRPAKQVGNNGVGYYLPEWSWEILLCGYTSVFFS